MKKVVYYTSTYFFDVSLEMINLLKEIVELHVLIEITPSSKNANIINIETLPKGKKMAVPEDLLSPKDYQYFKPYLDGVASVHFVIHHHPTGASISTLRVNKEVKQLFKKLKPDALHFEGFTMRTLPLITYFRSVKKIVLAIHDGALHSGEQNWKSLLPRYLFLNFSSKNKYLFYSKFTCRQFTKQRKIKEENIVLLKMSPFSYFSRLAQTQISAHEYLLFFGRISKYKGVDTLLDAMPDVLQNHPDEKLIIAGKGADDELLKHPVLTTAGENITFINRYIPNNELVSLIKEAKFIICPYRDASQSGVLMTTFALNKPVIAADTGAFAEDVINEVNGLLINKMNTGKLAAAINYALEKENYLGWENNLSVLNKENPWQQNRSIIEHLYS